MDTTYGYYIMTYVFLKNFLGNIACKFRGSLVYICHGASVFTLTAVAHERYHAICKPLLNHGRSIPVKRIIMQTWLLAILIHIPAMVFCGTQKYQHKQASCMCFERFPSRGVAQAYAISRYLMVYVLPLILVINRYLAVVLNLRKQSSSSVAANQTGCRSIKKKKHAVKMLITSSVFFFIAWTPFYTSYLLRDTGVEKKAVYR